MQKKFTKDYSVLTNNPKIAEKLEENFHFFNLKTEEEQERIMKKRFKANLRYVK